jgi:hypothetical protein
VSLADGNDCEFCLAELRRGEFTRRIAVEYAHDDPEHYDGISEFRCPDCGARVGRWSGKRLGPDEAERRYGQSP